MSANAIQERTVKANGIELNVAISGKPTQPALLLIHGLYDRWETWDPVIRGFAGRYQVIAPDLRGHARSEHPKSGYTPEVYAEDMVALLDELEISEVVAVGHSLGALVAGFLAANHIERVRGVVLVDPPFEQNEQSRQWLEILLEARQGSEEETYETIKELNILSGNDEEWRRQTDWLRATSTGPFEALIEMIDTGRTAQLYEVLGRVTCPALLLQADPESGGALSESGVALALERLQDCSHFRFDNTGHSIHLECTDDFVQVVNDFLDRSV